MKNFKIWMISSLVLVILMFMAGCASQQLVDIDRDSLQHPTRVRQGTNIDPREIVMVGIMKNGNRRAMTITQSDITFNNATPGMQTVTVRVGIVNRQAFTFQVEVMALQRITVASPPRTVLFKQGTEPDPAWPGLEIRGEWDQMGSEAIDLRLTEITGFMKDQPGRQTIRVAFQGQVATFDVDVRSMTALRITQQPEKTVYLFGEPLDITGLRVIGQWGDGIPDEEFEITERDITGFNSTLSGIQPLTITRNERTVTFNVEVLRLTNLEVRQFPDRIIYSFGEDLDLTGLVVYGNYTGSTPAMARSELIPIEQIEVLEYNPHNAGRTQVVRIAVRGIPHVSTQFGVTVNLPQ